MSEPLTSEELREIAAFVLADMDRNRAYTDERERNASLLFGALFGVALRAGAKVDTRRPQETK